MEKEFLSEYESRDQNRTATVYRDRANRVFVVDCYENHEVVKSEIAVRERQAEDIADDWCQPKDNVDTTTTDSDD